MPKEKSHTGRNLAVGGLVLAGASYVAGILTAPKSGKDTRKDIRKAALKARRDTEKKLKKAHSELNDVIDEVTSTATKAKTTADKELKAALATANNVKQKTRELISAIHEGEADDKDLDKALDEVKKAIKHVKSFVTK